MEYEGSPKHKLPWQPGRRGSLCPTEVDASQAQQLLDASTELGGARFAVHEGKAYAAHPSDSEGHRWHGFPVAWREVPEALWRDWERQGLLRRRDRLRHWESIE